MTGFSRRGIWLPAFGFDLSKGPLHDERLLDDVLHRHRQLEFERANKRE